MIETHNLTKKYGDNVVLNNISEKINDGEKVVIIGPSGSGKSTFLRCLNCMEDPTSGSIIFDGVDIADVKVDINIHRRKMGMVFQQFNLFNNKTVLQNIMLAPVSLAIKDNGGLFCKRSIRQKIIEEKKEQALALLKRIGLSDKADAYPSSSVATICTVGGVTASGYQRAFTDDIEC